MGIPIIGDIIGSVIGKAGDIAGKLIVDKDKRIQLQVDLERLKIEQTGAAETRLHDEMMGQIDVNKVEASSESLFVSGWRPAIGWIGATGLGYSFVLEPLLSWVAKVVFKYGGAFPALETASLLVLISGMLGFGTLRTYEKSKGVAQAPPDDGTESKGGPINILPPGFDNTPPEEAPWQK